MLAIPFSSLRERRADWADYVLIESEFTMHSHACHHRKLIVRLEYFLHRARPSSNVIAARTLSCHHGLSRFGLEALTRLHTEITASNK